MKPAWLAWSGGLWRFVVARPGTIDTSTDVGHPTATASMNMPGMPVPAVDPTSTESETEMVYPTTFTKVRSTTKTSILTPGPSATFYAESRVTADIVTTIEPWLSAPDPESFPYSITQTVITDRTVTYELTQSKDGPSTESVTRTKETVSSAWLIWETSPTDMPVGRDPQCAPGCTPSAIKAHPVCVEEGLETRCASQCTIRDYQWWCYRHKATDEALPQGKLCWANSTHYEQLMEPCDHTDFPPGCKPCDKVSGNDEQPGLY